MIKLYATAGVLAISGLLGWTLYQVTLGAPPDRYADCRSGSVAGGAIGGPFDLIDETGKPVTDAQVLAKPTLVYFGFASCADVCPLDNMRNVQTAEILGEKGMDVQPVFISVDPGRDTPALLAEYTDSFGPALLGLTGSDAQVKQAATAFKVYYQVPADRAEGYVVDHTTLTYLMLPGTGFVDFFQRETTAPEMAERVSCYLSVS